MPTGVKKAAAPQPEEKAKRRNLTPAERVAKLQAELEAARKAAEAKASKQSDELKAKRAKLIDQINERQTKVDAIDAQLKELGAAVQEDSSSDDDTSTDSES